MARTQSNLSTSRGDVTTYPFLAASGRIVGFDIGGGYGMVKLHSEELGYHFTDIVSSDRVEQEVCLGFSNQKLIPFDTFYAPFSGLDLGMLYLS